MFLMAMNLTIQLPKFEGPMALLIYLIRKEEMDIFDIKINEITKQYLEYIKLMKELDLELAGEFIAMASTLIHIKSRMLLPQYGENGEVIETEDPRKELVQRLLEYQKYQEAAKNLYERPLLGRDVFSRGIREKLESKEDEIVLEENALFSLISAYRNALRSIKKKIHQVAARAQSIASRILEIKDRIPVGAKIGMSELIDSLTEKRRQVLITFLSLLELGKLGFITLYQTETYQEIYIEAKKTIDTNLLDRVEEYDSMRADEIAAQMMEKAQKIEDEDVEDFVLRDGGDESDEQLVLEAPVDESEMASDQDILEAEKEIQS
jgi:segregation and condensation protein A